MTYWNEALHGVANNGIATVFPGAGRRRPLVGYRTLFHQEGNVIGIEGRAKFNDYAIAAQRRLQMVDGPDVLDAEHQHFPRPALGPRPGNLRRRSVSHGHASPWTFIKGMQGDDPNYMLAMACAKHYAVHSGPEPDRHRFDAEPSERDLYETYLPQFEMAVREGHVGGVMGAYNAVYGVPACASSFLLTDLLRKQWGFEGYVVSDCGAIGDISSARAHHYVNTPEEAAADAVKAGCNLCCGGDYNALVRAVQKGLITEKEIDQALYYTLVDALPAGLVRSGGQGVLIPKSAWTRTTRRKHAALALKVAEESIVLLKNDGILPLEPLEDQTHRRHRPQCQSRPTCCKAITTARRRIRCRF